jgi:hypothetical protein
LSARSQKSVTEREWYGKIPLSICRIEVVTDRPIRNR